MTISRSQMPRQMYGLGSLVKKIGKTVKKIVKSPVGKAAILGFGGAGLMGMGPLSALGGLGASTGTGIASILSKGKSLLGGLSTAQKITGALSLGSAFAGMEDQQVEELKRNPEALRSYLAQYYRNLNQNATDQEVNEFVESNMIEYKADGGRIGYREGDLAGGQFLNLFPQSQGELAYDATNTNIYGSSAASFSPKTIMNQSGDQVQAGFGKTPGLNPDAPTLTSANNFLKVPFMPNRPSGPVPAVDLPGGQQPFPFITKPERPATLPGMRPGNIPGTDVLYSTLRGGPQPGVDLQAQPGVDLQQLKIAGNPNGIGVNTMPSMPGNNMSFPRIMPATPVPFQAQPMPFAQQGLAQFNKSSPMAQIAGMADGGRMGYNEGTPEMGMIDPNKAKQAKQMIGMGADQDLISTITGLTKEQVQFLMTENKADGGRIGYAMGDTAEQNAIQASGIMNLPLNENPAGITELDLRETGGFIPPVGVKEKEDDIPAMLSNNEFVFTADAVRGMGDGNVNKGAQRMYDMMKKLEQGGRV